MLLSFCQYQIGMIVCFFSLLLLFACVFACVFAWAFASFVCLCVCLFCLLLLFAWAFACALVWCFCGGRAGSRARWIRAQDSGTESYRSLRHPYWHPKYGIGWQFGWHSPSAPVLAPEVRYRVAIWVATARENCARELRARTARGN